MRSFLGVILAMMVSIPTMSSAQQQQAPLQRVHLMTGAGTLPRNPTNRLGKLLGKKMAEVIVPLIAGVGNTESASLRATLRHLRYIRDP